MSDRQDIFEQQLKQTCRIVGARWAVWAERTETAWDFGVRHALSRARETALAEFIQQSKISAWLSGALSGGRMRSKSLAPFEDVEVLDCQRLYVFPNTETQSAILVGADALQAEARGFFRVLALHSTAEIKEASRRTRNLSLIHQVVCGVVGLPEVSEIARSAAASIAEYFDYEYVVIGLLDETGKFLINEGIGGTRADSIELGSYFPVLGGITGRVLETGDSYTTNDVSLDSLYYSLFDWQAESEMCVALKDASRVFGLINIELARKYAFSESDVLLFESLAGVLSSVMMNARRYQQLQVLVKQLQAFKETALDTSADLDMTVVFERVIQRVRQLTGARGASLALIRDEEHTLEVVVTENPWGEYTGFRIPLTKGVLGQVAVSGEPLVVEDYAVWPDRLTEEPLFRAIAGVPVKYKERVIATIGVADDRPGWRIKPEDIQALELIAPQVAVSLHNAQLYNELQEHVRRLAASQSALIQSEKLAAAGRMTASIAHEINNPLQAVQNCMHLAGRQELSTEQRQYYLELAETELSRLMSIVQRMLDLYRPAALEREPMDVNECVERVLSLLCKQLEEKGIRVHTHLLPNLPKIWGVGSQIQQVVLNLLINGIEAMPRGGDLYLETRVQGPEVQMMIEDSGSGVSEDERERIFEPFSSTKDGGLGLGLSISYGIVTAHGGKLNLIQGRGSGACFQVVLPIGGVP